MRRSPITIEEVLADRRGEDLIEVPLSSRAFFGFLAISSIFLIGILWQFISISVVNHAAYERRAIANMSDGETMYAPRGIIVDRFGVPIVENEPSFNAFLVPHELPRDADSRDAVLADARLLLGIDETAFATFLADKPWTWSGAVPLLANVSHDAIVALTARPVPGIRLEPSFRRRQRVPYAFSHVVGYTGFVNDADLARQPNLTSKNMIGRDGIEAFYDDALRGTDGSRVLYRTAQGSRAGNEVRYEPVAGKTLATSIDAGLQEYLYNRLVTGLKDLGRNSGVGIAMNPKNGEVLALVNVPGYDTNRIAAALQAPFQPLFNRAISGLYNPGSTIKPVIAIAALVEGIVTPLTQIYSPGYLEVPNPYNPSNPTRLPDAGREGWSDIYTALAKSSNVYFYEVGGGYRGKRGLGIERLRSWWALFGLAGKTNIDLVGERAGVVPNPLAREAKTGIPWGVGDTYNVSIGQGDLLVTPIELLNTVSTVANGGIVRTPYLVTAIDGVTSTPPAPLVDLRDRIGIAVRHVQQGMRNVVRESFGTARSLASLPLAVAAKTGTAQVENNTKINAFFVGYAPFEDPSIALLILIENAREGSVNTIPIARDIFMWYHENRLTRTL